MKILGLKISKFWRFFIIFVVAGTGVAYLIGLLINTGIFRQESIEQKYCYYFKNDSISKVYSADNIEKAYQIIAYFYCGINDDRKGIIVGDNMYTIKKIREVEVLEYTEDSILARIRYKYFSKLRGGMIIETKSYVPTFTLHDTVPKGYKVSNKEQMKE